VTPVFKKIFILLLFISVRSFGQSLPPNIGFDDGTFGHWELFAGHVDNLGNPLPVPTSPIPNRFVIFDKVADAKQLDPYGNFPVVCPNGSNNSIRLGDLVKTPAGTNGNYERATYTFTVPANTDTYSIIFNYAVVLQNPKPQHEAAKQPKFTAKVYNVTDDKYVDCPSFNFVAPATELPGFQLSTSALANGEVYYKDWSTATINLTGYSGKEIRLEFTTNDCVPSAHFCYAYLDINNNDTYKPISGNTYCNNQPNVALNGPTGFKEYHWFKTADMTAEIGQGQTLTIPSPPDGTGYAVKVIPYADAGCVDFLYTVVNRINSNLVFKIADTLHSCAGVGVDLTAASVTTGSSTDLKFTYFTTPVAADNNYVRDPKSVDPGTYYIRAVNSEGCTDILPVVVSAYIPQITFTQPTAVTYPATVGLEQTFTKQKDLAYSYFSDAGASKALSNYNSIDRTGTYYIKVVTAYGCESIVPVKVSILPPPPYIVSAVNAFTPNNDGVNDYFNLHIEGYVKFNNLRIFNRYGQLMYTATSSAALWDGNFKSNGLPAGTYYWLFDGMDTYYNTKITKSGSVAIIR
jgi:gliding motility-associated-like protein